MFENIRFSKNSKNYIVDEFPIKKANITNTIPKLIFVKSLIQIVQWESVQIRRKVGQDVEKKFKRHKWLPKIFLCRNFHPSRTMGVLKIRGEIGGGLMQRTHATA